MPDVLVEYHPSKERQDDTNINYFGFEEHGIFPIGIKALVESAAVNKSSFFARGRTAPMYGVLMFRPRVGQASVDTAIQALYDAYPINDGIKRMGVITIEKGNLRGIHVVGDFDDLAKFWSHLYSDDIALNQTDTKKDAICWTGYGSFNQYVLYLDFDELSPRPDDFHRIYGERVKLAIDLVFDEILKHHPGARAQTFFNLRARPTSTHTQPRLYKYSFHVHFYNVLVQDITTFKYFLASLTQAPRKRIWKLDGNGVYQVTDDRTAIYDLSVYGGGKQLFRGPFCGKGGDQNSILRPIYVIETEGKFEVEFDEDDVDHDHRMELIFRARIRSPLVTAAGFKIIEFPVSPLQNFTNPDNSRRQLPQLPTVRHESCEMYNFLKPLIMSEVIPAWQRARKKIMGCLSDCVAVVPVENITISMDKMSDQSSAVRFLKVEGDTFCQSDPSHHHSRGNDVISIGLNMQTCRIWQFCFACNRKSGESQWLHTGNKIDIISRKDSEMQYEDYFSVALKPHTFFLRYFSDRIVYNKQRDSVFVYDELLKVWVSGTSANPIIGSLIDKVNDLYTGYMYERQELVAQNALRVYIQNNPGAPPEEIEVKKNVIFTDGRKFLKLNQTLLNFTPQQRMKVSDELKNFTVKISVDKMNPLAHLIPMANSMAYDVFSGEISPISRLHYFTGLVNAEMTQNEMEIKEIEEWFNEISTGNPEKARYCKIIAAYCMTFLTHDRKFYVLKGSGKNGKGLFKEFLVRVLSGAHSSESRWKSLNQSYWEKKSNSTHGAEAASPETFGLLDKSMYYTDDMERTPIDSGKLKRIVASEAMSGRQLYGKPIVVEPQGKVLWTTNHMVDLNGDDNAIWERFEQVMFNTKYVENEGLVAPEEFRFRQNNVKYLELLNLTDAFFTVCMKTLHSHYGILERHPDSGHPLILAPFTIPLEMKLSKAESRAQQLPLANFIKLHTRVTDQPMEFAVADELFENYLIFLENSNERRIRSETTKMSFLRQLLTSLEIKCAGKFVVGVQLKPGLMRNNRRADDDHRISADNLLL